MANKIHKQDGDSYSSEVNGIPVGAHFYFLDRTLFGIMRENLAPVTQSGQVLTFLYLPFLTRRDIDLIEIPYDQGTYGSIDPKNPDPFAHSKQCYVYKVAPDVAVADKPLGVVDKYTNKKTKRTKSYNWVNEAKLFLYPYQFPVVADYMNSPLVLIPHLLDSENPYFTIMARQEISYTGAYIIYAQGYKGDINGVMEGLHSASSLELPTGSSSYGEFMANSKSQFLASNVIASRNESLAQYKANKQAQLGYSTANMGYNAQIQSGVISALGTMTGGGGSIFGMLGAQTSAGVSIASNRLQANTSKDISNMQTQTAHQLASLSNSLDKKNRIELSQAFISDLVNQPRNLALAGGDILQSITNSRKCVDALRYDIKDNYKQKISLYFTMYGYKQNKYLDLSNDSLKSRKYWNYIKTYDANIEGRENMPMGVVDQIRNIFDTGITFWHHKNMEDDGIKMYEYTNLDNYEVNLDPINE